MFLSVKRAACSDVLNRVMDMIRTVLDYSLNMLTPEPDLEELSLLVEPKLRILLKKEKIRRDVEALFALTYPQRAEAALIFAGDRAFADHIDDTAYGLHPCLPANDEAGGSLAVLGRLCNDVYDSIRGGLPGQKDLFSVAMLQREYEEANGENGRVCPVCVRENLFGIGEGEVDHYFPRKQFPALALHPYNLLPVCRDCNGPRGKHTKSPVDASDAGPGELRTVFLPYLRPGKDEIAFAVSEDASRHIVMKPGPGGDAGTEKRIANMERLYDLGRRWSRVFPYVYEDVRAELSHVAAQEGTRGGRLARLRTILRANADSTKGRRDFIKGVYCGWLLEKSDEELEELFLDGGACDEVTQEKPEESQQRKGTLMQYTWNDIEQHVLSCTCCPLCRTRRRPVMGRGDRQADIMLIAEAPGGQEDTQGLPFVGSSGEVLDRLLNDCGLTREEIYITNIIKCHPPGNRDPLEEEKQACFPYLKYETFLLKPAIIVCLGRVAAQRIIAPDFKITRQHGTWTVRKNCALTATWHPSALLRDPSKYEFVLEDFREIVRRRDALKCP